MNMNQTQKYRHTEVLRAVVTGTPTALYFQVWSVQKESGWQGFISQWQPEEQTR